MILVVDANVALKWYLDEPFSDEARALLRTRHALVTPIHAVGEIGHVLSKRLRKQEISRDHLDSALKGIYRTLALLPLTDLLEEAVNVAVESGQTFYDALYVAAAVRSGGTLVSSDDRLLRALRSSRWGPLVMALSEAANLEA